MKPEGLRSKFKGMHLQVCQQRIQLLLIRYRSALTFGNALSRFVNASEKLLFADKAIVLRYGYNLETTRAGRQDNALPTGRQT